MVKLIRFCQVGIMDYWGYIWTVDGQCWVLFYWGYLGIEGLLEWIGSGNNGHEYRALDIRIGML